MPTVSPRLIIEVLVIVVIVAVALWVRHQWNAGQAAIREAAQLREQVTAFEQSSRRIGEVLTAAEAATAASDQRAAKVRYIYREAVRTDPTCAEWSRQPVGCPIGSQQ